MPIPRLAFLLTLCASPALAETVTTVPATLTAPPAEWLGPVPHLVIMGKAKGHDLNIQIDDMAKAADVAEFAGKREYLPQDGGGYRYGDFEVSLKAVIDGAERAFELEFENHDLHGLTLPAALALTTENFPKGEAAFLEFSMEWETGAGSVNEELGGYSGTLSLLQDQGTPDGKGLLPDGMIGGHVVAEKDGETVVISFTVPVAEYEIDD